MRFRFRAKVALVLFAVTFLLVPAGLALAQDDGFGNFEVGFPSNQGTGQGESIDTFVQKNPDDALITFISIGINVITALIVILGLISIVIGGYIYMTARGNAQQVGTAKVWIGSALLGITLALTAWLILNTISPQFTSGLRDPELNPGQGQNQGQGRGQGQGQGGPGQGPDFIK